MKRYLIFVFPLFLYSCNWFKPVPPQDDLTQLPPETQEGKDTFGCLVNGQVWRNQGEEVWGPRDLQGGYHQGAFSISADKIIEPLSEGIAIHISKHFHGVGLYQLSANFNTNGTQYALYSHSDACEYITDSLNIGILEITRFDSISPYIVSGRFHFTVSTPGCDTVRITEGRFDHKYAN
ncbi:hypothetical protein I5M27_09145 [Adhaeribacter sp. BT258]|uniref:Lipoprotein n=1 Tax=Adhaeribacter terrigena TaxID=2793070 RepID=A0ABS1C173_9BACT|nr:DUF6252 family protein [Adhaeribacter terrigena]MBK0403149.1 hypothetical protein [Adhaeribacter terrigena]